MYSLFVYPIIYILPAYIANGAPVIFGGGRAIDMGKKLKGKPIFGPHKTIRGFLAGIASGILVGAFESIFLPYMLAVGVLLSFGAHAGDLLGSFIKRRLNRKPGSNVPLLDQYMFFAFALIFAYPMGHMPGIGGLIFLTILTGILHKLTNIGAHKMKLKKVPW
ncbi:MAG: CDP-2,3-bis-(O-geranylgeranyl)-sn-glycerol synthase [Candidatus Micrarchaeia archaeon]